MDDESVLQPYFEDIGRKRKQSEIYDDGIDLPQDDVYNGGHYKKSKTEIERDLETIESILIARKELCKNQKTYNRDLLKEMTCLSEFASDNMSSTVPNWSFLPVVLHTGEKVYVRFHSDTHESTEIKLLRTRKAFQPVLSNRTDQLWNDARMINQRKKSGDSKKTAEVAMNTDSYPRGDLWVEKYKPKSYVDLLSEEVCNRNLLRWLTMWEQNANKKIDKNSDENGPNRPMQKIALLCGPPGLGKTTLAHTIAAHAGYIVRELNASNDRSVEAFRIALESGTQMTSVLNNEQRPNCIVLDEIDGAPKQSIDFLINFVNGFSVKKTKGGKSVRSIAKRPIICICNDLYVPSLRQLRQIAYIIDFPPIDPSRLTERLSDISRKEHVKTDLGSLFALVEKSGNDIRSSITIMQFLNSTRNGVFLEDILNYKFGEKDRKCGLFDFWKTLFHTQKHETRNTRFVKSNNGENTENIVANKRKTITELVDMVGDCERLIDGVHENYLSQKGLNSYLERIAASAEWFCFSDSIHTNMILTQNYIFYSFLQYGFVAWHSLLASLATPRLKFPTKSLEVYQKTITRQLIMHTFRKGVSAGSFGIGSGQNVLIETVPWLQRILSPNLRPVSLQLLTPKERFDLKRTVCIMLGLGLSFMQLQSKDGTYEYQMEPDVYKLWDFHGAQNCRLSYFEKQLISREIELERMRRTTLNNSEKVQVQPVQQKKIPAVKPKAKVGLDFFGRVADKSTVSSVRKGQIDEKMKNPVWYQYKEGLNNAVRKDVTIRHLI